MSQIALSTAVFPQSCPSGNSSKFSHFGHKSGVSVEDTQIYIF